MLVISRFFSVFPLFSLCGGGQVFEHFFHSGGTLLLHLVRDMSIGFEGERGCKVAQIGLHGLDVEQLHEKNYFRTLLANTSVLNAIKLPIKAALSVYSL